MNPFMPKTIGMHRQSREVELTYNDGKAWRLTCEYLRVFSPSAEVRGHGEGEAILQTGKINLRAKDVEPVGNYGLKFIFEDGHDSGIYTWEYLRKLCEHQQQNWAEYLQQLNDAGASRDPDVSVVRFV